MALPKPLKAKVLIRIKVLICEDQTLTGERFIQPAVASKLLFEFARNERQSAPNYEKLNERETAIISRLSQGLSNREIAEDLALAEGTVKNYVSGILAKLHTTNRV